MIIPIKINDFLNQLKKLGFHFNLILKKASGSEPLVVGTLPMEEVREIVSQELTTPALNLASSSLNSPEMSGQMGQGPRLPVLQICRSCRPLRQDSQPQLLPVLDVPLIRRIEKKL